MEKRPLYEIIAEVEKKLVDEKLSAREILQILREIENNALISLFLAQLQQSVTEDVAEEIKNATNPKGIK